MSHDENDVLDFSVDRDDFGDPSFDPFLSEDCSARRSKPGRGSPSVRARSILSCGVMEFEHDGIVRWADYFDQTPLLEALE